MSDERNITSENCNDEIMYSVNRRKMFYIIIGDIAPAALLIFLAFLIFAADNVSIIMLCVGILSFLIGILFFVESLVFNRLSIYKDKVVIDRFIFGETTIKIEDIERVDIYTHSMSKTMMSFTLKSKSKTWSIFKPYITGLYDDDMLNINKVITDLQKGN